MLYFPYYEKAAVFAIAGTKNETDCIGYTGYKIYENKGKKQVKIILHKYSFVCINIIFSQFLLTIK